jgi:hypothetical protein
VTLNRTFIATMAWTALRRMLATAASATVSNVVWMIGTKGRPGRSNCSNENIMVCLPDQRSTDRPATFSRRRRLLSVSIDQLDKCGCTAYLLGVQFLVLPSDGLAGYIFPLYNALAVQSPPRVRLGPYVHPARPTLLHFPTVYSPGWATAMLNLGWCFLHPSPSSLPRTSPAPSPVTFYSSQASLLGTP